MATGCKDARDEPAESVLESVLSAVSFAILSFPSEILKISAYLSSFLTIGLSLMIYSFLLLLLISKLIKEEVYMFFRFVELMIFGSCLSSSNLLSYRKDLTNGP